MSKAQKEFCNVAQDHISTSKFALLFSLNSVKKGLKLNILAFFYTPGLIEILFFSDFNFLFLISFYQQTLVNI